jgi:xanthine dehydrogenase small subunit
MLALEDFYLGYRKTALEPGEFVAEIHVPLPAADASFKCYKISKRFDQDISAVLGAFALELSPNRTVKKFRIAFGGMAEVPKRAVQTEKAMLGKPWTEATVETGQAALAGEFSPISDMRASADYRLTVAQNLLRKLYIETTEPGTATRVVAQMAG